MMTMGAETVDEREMASRRLSWARWAVVAIVTVALFCGLSWRAYLIETERTVTDISQVYLQEMTLQMRNHFETNLENQFMQLKTVTASLSETELRSVENLQGFLRRVKGESDFSHIALISDRGVLYGPSGVRTMPQEVEALKRLAAGNERLLVMDDSLWGADMILLGQALGPLPFADGNLIAAAVGLDTAGMGEKLALDRRNSASYGDIVTREGDFVVKSQATHLYFDGANVFSILDEQVDFDPGYDLETVRREMEAGESGMAAIVSAQMLHEYIYYAPIPDTDWYIFTSMSYETVNGQVSHLSRFMMTLSISLLAAVLVLLGIFFRVYQKEQMAHRRQLLAARDRAEAANRAKSDFLSQMSHEIRTPLNGIIGMTEVLRHYARHPERVEGCADKITTSSQHLLALVNDVLDMSKIESGRVELHPERTSLAQILHTITVVFYPQARERALAFQILLPEDLPEQVTTDSLRLSQILTNLMSNAVKFTAPGGRVTLRLERADKGDGQLWLRFSVEDTGRGIAPENLERIFDAFTQENGGITRQYGGTGLGLPISRRFAQMMGGTVTVASQLGRGSCFTLELPFPPEPPAALPQRGRIGAALVLDPFGPTRQRTAGLLRRAGLTVSTAQLEDEAETLMGRVAADGAPEALCLISWDFAQDPEELAVRLRRSAGDMPVQLVITGYDPDECGDIQAAMDAEATLCRPVFPQDLAALLAALERAGGDGAVMRCGGQARGSGESGRDGANGDGVSGAAARDGKTGDAGTGDAGRAGARDVGAQAGNGSAGTAASDSAAAVQQSVLTGKRVLVAEDNDINLEIILELLGMVGARTDAARNGQEAVERFKASPVGTYDLVLMDIQMPVMNGYQAAKLIRQLSRADAAEVVILAMSADSFQEDVRHSFEAGMNGHVAKPFAFEDVEKAYEAVKR